VAPCSPRFMRGCSAQDPGSLAHALAARLVVRPAENDFRRLHEEQTDSVGRSIDTRARPLRLTRTQVKWCHSRTNFGLFSCDQHRALSRRGAVARMNKGWRRTPTGTLGGAGTSRTRPGRTEDGRCAAHVAFEARSAAEGLAVSGPQVRLEVDLLRLRSRGGSGGKSFPRPDERTGAKGGRITRSESRHASACVARPAWRLERWRGHATTTRTLLKNLQGRIVYREIKR